MSASDSSSSKPTYAASTEPGPSRGTLGTHNAGGRGHGDTAAGPGRGLQGTRPLLSPAATELLAGFVAGAANVTSGYPFDTVKVRLQSAPPGAYRGALHCARAVVAGEGARGLFRGLASPLVGGTAETGVNYMVYSRVLAALGRAEAEAARAEAHRAALAAGAAAGAAFPPNPLLPNPLPPSLGAVACAGAVAGVALSGILAPTELVKVRLQQAGSAALYPGGPLEVLRAVVAHEGGVRGLARGLGATLAREVPGNALFFAVYEALRRQLGAATTAHAVVHADCGGDGAPHGGGAHPSHWLAEAGAAILCGGVAGSVMWAVVLPIDVAKTRLQTARPGSAWDVGLRRHWAMLWAEGGLRSLYSGLGPTLARAFPANAAQWLAWELALRGLGGGGPER